MLWLSPVAAKKTCNQTGNEIKWYLSYMQYVDCKVKVTGKGRGFAFKMLQIIALQSLFQNVMVADSK